MRPSDYVRGYPQNLARPRWVSVPCTYLPSMPRTLPISRCSSGKPLQFRWFGYPPSPQGLDLETATEKFLSVVTGSNRELNDYVVAMARAEFRHTLKIATSGQLSPSRHVKPIESANPPPLFEIRWQGVTVREMNQDGQLEDRRLLIRMYHSEPTNLPQFFIGHHIHEKLISGDHSTWLLQNEEIEIALGFYHSGLQGRWGIKLEN